MSVQLHGYLGSLSEETISSSLRNTIENVWLHGNLSSLGSYGFGGMHPLMARSYPLILASLASIIIMEHTINNTLYREDTQL